MELFIKNMVCDRCVMVVRQQLEALSVEYKSVQLGTVVLGKALSEEQFTGLKEKLSFLGFELLDDRKATIVSQVKSAVIQYIHGGQELNKKFSVLLSEKLGLDYHYISALFSSVEGITLEKYVILHRIERAKELLAYNEMNLSEIADALGYSSVQHLSQQFKKETGLTPSQYKQLKENNRRPLDQVGS
jgi:AraC family transcriptional regulator